MFLDYHVRKIIPLFLINKYFRNNFHFHPNLSFNLSLVNSLPEFYKQILIKLSPFFVPNSEVPSCIQSIHIKHQLNNKQQLTDSGPVYLQSFADKNVNFLDN